MIIAIIIGTGFIIGFILFRKVEVLEYSPPSKILLPFYKISVYLIERLISRKAGRLNKYFIRPRVIDHLRQINPTDRSYKHIKKYYADKLAISLAVIFVASILCILTIISQNNKDIIINDKYLNRGIYKENEKLFFSVDEIQDQEITVTVDEQQMTEEETFLMFQEAQNQLNSSILGENESFLEIQKNMNLPTQLEGKPIKVEWDSDNFEILASDGEVNNEKLDEKGVIVNLTMTLTYHEYMQEEKISVRVLPPLRSKTEELTRIILEKIEQTNVNTITKEYLELPTNIEGKQISWDEMKSKTGIYVIWIGIFASIAIFYGKDNELKKDINKRNQQILSDYPDIVSKLTLLLGAGLTIKGAWQKIALDYREKKTSNPKHFRYAYEEMLITYYEIIGGISEAKAYEDFGKRCKNQRYLKLSALITQNLRKGSRGLSQILLSESLDAFEDRKAYAKTIGEEAVTKLMVPMFLDLILVLIIIIIPACMSFQM